MKKKVVSVLLCVAMTATMLLGCSAGSEKSDSKKSSKSESGGTTEMKVDGDATTINVWTFIELHQKFYTEMANFLICSTMICTTNYHLHWNQEKELRM